MKALFQQAGVVGIAERRPSLLQQRARLPSLIVSAYDKTFLREGEGPGSGKRRIPAQNEIIDMPEKNFSFDMFSAAEMEQLFASSLKISKINNEFQIQDVEKAGVIAFRLLDGGPSTGRKQRPPHAAPPNTAARPSLPYPTTGPAADLKRDLMTKKRMW